MCGRLLALAELGVDEDLELVVADALGFGSGWEYAPPVLLLHGLSGDSEGPADLGPGGTVEAGVEDGRELGTGERVKRVFTLAS